MKTIIFATTNKGKIASFRAALDKAVAPGWLQGSTLKGVILCKIENARAIMNAYAIAQYRQAVRYSCVLPRFQGAHAGAISTRDTITL